MMSTKEVKGHMTIFNPTSGLEEQREVTAVAETDDSTTDPTQLDLIEAQVTYTAMMTDTLLEV